MHNIRSFRIRIRSVPSLLLALTGTLIPQTEGNPAAQGSPHPHPQLRYHPEGEAIVCQNGGSDFNRPLCCNQTWPTIYVGEFTANAGHYAVMGLVNAEIPYWKVWKLELTNPGQQRLSESKNLRSADTGAS